MSNNPIDEFLDQINPIVDSRYSSDTSPPVKSFIGSILEFFPLQDLINTPIADISNSLICLWEYFQQVPEGGKVRVFNPTLEEDGWISPRTIIFIVKQDMPFLVDSMRMELNRRNVGIHILKSTIFKVERDKNKRLINAAGIKKETVGGAREAVIYFEIDLHSAAEELADLRNEILEVLGNVSATVEDFQVMLDRVKILAEQHKNFYAGKDKKLLQESLDFLNWIHDGFFTFLACAEYRLTGTNGKKMLVEEPEKRRGIFRCHQGEAKASRPLMSPGLQSFFESDQLITFNRSSVRSKVHRNAYPDYVIVKNLNAQGEAIGETRFMGLYTSPVYTMSPSTIPVIRQKLSDIIEESAISPNSHSGKTLRQIMEVHPREELFHGSKQELLEMFLGILEIYDRRTVRLFMRVDAFEKYINCIVFVPKDIYRTEIRESIQKLLCEKLDACESEFTTYFPETILTRTLYILRIESQHYKTVDLKQLEKQIQRIARNWSDDFHDSAIQHWGEEHGRYYARKYARAFPISYQEHFETRLAVKDIDLFSTLADESDIAMCFYQPADAQQQLMRFKLFHRTDPLELSDLIPVLEHLGFHVQGEHPYRIAVSNTEVIWMQDFSLQYCLRVNVDVAAVRNNFQEAFSAIWHGDAESDSFNRLVLGAGLDWRSVGMLRLYARYMKQLGFNLSQNFIADTLSRNLEITRNLVMLFRALFDPHYAEDESARDQPPRLQNSIIDALTNVANLNEDKVLRFYLTLINATLRTNFFQLDQQGKPKYHLSVKLATRTIEDVPKPRPEFEIFVYSARVEGVHLRGGKIARGGIRWSDRAEDYRTEVLGLVKAQQVKNAVIVPTGAKGGFIPKQLDRLSNREAIMEEGIACYRIFIQGLLDLTDNIRDGKVTPPLATIRRDEDDPYLVVAADKGTASFSDIANGISRDYNYWLGDAFASGGGHGYDHKKMGITAKGAWIAVQRHFREQGIDIQKEDFTVVGIGDMAGDVFGNSMLLSEHIQLVAAFNHAHIFLDPNPDPEKSLIERKRLFELPRSSWEDFNPDIISQGGGVYSRAAKSIPLSQEVRARFTIDKDSLQPNELIRLLLQAKVDLIWNGGIGTYVKSSSETHADAGDRNNDALRVNGSELNCKVFGEGGNLGMTQRGRVEFCLHGGACNADFIDNSAGVDCSDHEVNIKILLNDLIANEDLTHKQRNQLLEDMKDDVAELVLKNNYVQTGAISMAQFHARQNLNEFWRFMTEMENEGHLDRQLEFLPDDETMLERQSNAQYLTRPELAILISYAKITLKQELLNSSLPEDPYVQHVLKNAFPKKIEDNFPGRIYGHKLKREIITTQLANQMVDRMGLIFYKKQVHSTGATHAEIAKAWVVVRDVLDLERVWKDVSLLDYQVPARAQIILISTIMRLGRRTVRWILRNRRSGINPETEIAQLSAPLITLQQIFPDLLEGDLQSEWYGKYDNLMALGYTETIARLAASANSLYFGFGVADITLRTQLDIATVARLYFSLGNLLSLEWFSEQIVQLETTNRWQDLARESFVDDLEYQRRTLTRVILLDYKAESSPDRMLQQWQQAQQNLITRWRNMVDELRAASGIDITMISVARHEFLNLVQASLNS